jgi:hypothetical protein
MTNFEAFENQKDIKNANIYLMYSLGEVLSKDKAEFVNLLNECGIKASVNEDDSTLIEKYVDNVINKKLLLGTALLLNMKNKKDSFDGDEDMYDQKIKKTYNTMRVFYIGDENYSNAVDPVGAIAEGVGSLAKLGSTAIEAGSKKKGRGFELVQAKEAGRQALVQNVLQTKQAQIAAEQKNLENQEKTKRAVIIGGIALAVVGVVVYIAMKGKSKK